MDGEMILLILYTRPTKPNVTSKKKATTQPMDDEFDSIFDAVFEEENLHKQEEKKDE